MNSLACRIALLVFAALALFPAAAQADHAWDGFHWERTSAAERTLTVAESVAANYNPAAVRAAWDAATPALRFDLAGKKGDITATSKRYGNNGWLGLAQIWVVGDHISRAQVKLNDFYYDFFPDLDRNDVRQHVYCHELGHAIGLDHRANPDPSCMNEENDLSEPATTYPDPDGHDVDQLALIYDHVDGGGGGGGGKGGPPCSKNPSHPNCHERGPITIHTYPAPGGKR